MDQAKLGGGDRSRISVSSLMKLFAIMALFASTAANGERVVVYVDRAAPMGGDGTSWSKAYNDLQDGFDRLRGLWGQLGPSESTLKIAQGTYRPDRGTGQRNQMFAMDWYPGSPSIEVLGGFAGFMGVDPEKRDFERTRTILSGDLNGDDGPNFSNRDDNSFMIFGMGPVYGDNCSVLVEGLEFSGATETVADAPYGYFATAANVYGSTSSEMPTDMNPAVVFKSCRFQDNRTLTSNGAALRVSGNRVELRDCQFVGNRTADGAGGAIAWSSGYSAFLPISITDCTFEDNEARLGGAVFYGGGSLAMERSVFANNRALIDGGAIFCDSQLDLYSSLVLANGAGNTGGAIACVGIAPINLWNCTIAENHAISGSAIQCGYGVLQATNSIFWRNPSSGANPAIDLWPGFSPIWVPTVFDGVVLDGGLASVRLPAGGSPPTGSLVSADPGFIRERPVGDNANAWSLWNYRLVALSPAAGTGAIANWIGQVFDLDGRPSAWAKFDRADIGCYFLNTSDCAANLDRDPDQVVDDSDFTRFVVAYELTISPPALPQADFNRDGIVDDADFSIFASAYDALICP